MNDCYDKEQFARVEGDSHPKPLNYLNIAKKQSELVKLRGKGAPQSEEHEILTLKFYSRQKMIAGAKEAISIEKVRQINCSLPEGGETYRKRELRMQELDGAVEQDSRWLKIKAFVDASPHLTVDNIVCFGIPTMKAEGALEFGENAYANHLLVGKVYGRFQNQLGLQLWIHCPKEIVSTTDAGMRERALAIAGSPSPPPYELVEAATAFRMITENTIIMSFTPGWCVRQTLADRMPWDKMPRIIICNTIDMYENTWFEDASNGGTIFDPTAPHVQDNFGKYYDSHSLKCPQDEKDQEMWVGGPARNELSLYVRNKTTPI